MALWGGACAASWSYLLCLHECLLSAHGWEWTLWRHLVPGASVQQPPASRVGASTPLLEEKGHICRLTLLPQRACPGGPHGASMCAALPATDHPLECGQPGSQTERP